MALLSVIFWMVLATQAQTNNVCIWDRRGEDYLNNMLNGQYYYDGGHNNHASFKKSQHQNCGPPQLYIYWHQYNFWAIGASKGADSYFAQCEQDDIVSCTAGQWGVAENSATDADATMRVISGNCPQWNCGSITTNAIDYYCQSFTEQIGINTWKSTEWDYVWYYSTMYLSWICVNDAQYDYTDCRTTYQLKTSSESASWPDLSDGQSTSVNVEYADPSQTRLTMTCTGSGAAQPTPPPVPTPQPTAPNPAANPASVGTKNNGDDTKKSKAGTAWIIPVVILIILGLCVAVVWFLWKAKKARGYKEAEKDEYADTVQMNQSRAQNSPWVRNTNIQTISPNPYEQQNMHTMYNQGANP
eukprot:459216_1